MDFNSLYSGKLSKFAPQNPQSSGGVLASSVLGARDEDPSGIKNKFSIAKSFLSGDVKEGFTKLSESTLKIVKIWEKLATVSEALSRAQQEWSNKLSKQADKWDSLKDRIDKRWAKGTENLTEKISENAMNFKERWEALKVGLFKSFEPFLTSIVDTLTALGDKVLKILEFLVKMLQTLMDIFKLLVALFKDLMTLLPRMIWGNPTTPGSAGGASGAGAGSGQASATGSEVVNTVVDTVTDKLIPDAVEKHPKIAPVIEAAKGVVKVQANATLSTVGKAAQIQTDYIKGTIKAAVALPGNLWDAAKGLFSGPKSKTIDAATPAAPGTTSSSQTTQDPTKTPPTAPNPDTGTATATTAATTTGQTRVSKAQEFTATTVSAGKVEGEAPAAKPDTSTSTGEFTENAVEPAPPEDYKKLPKSTARIKPYKYEPPGLTQWARDNSLHTDKSFSTIMHYTSQALSEIAGRKDDDMVRENDTGVPTHWMNPGKKTWHRFGKPEQHVRRRGPASVEPPRFKSSPNPSRPSHSPRNTPRRTENKQYNMSPHVSVRDTAPTGTPEWSPDTINDYYEIHEQPPKNREGGSEWDKWAAYVKGLSPEEAAEFRALPDDKKYEYIFKRIDTGKDSQVTSDQYRKHHKDKWKPGMRRPPNEPRVKSTTAPTTTTPFRGNRKPTTRSVDKPVDESGLAEQIRRDTSDKEDTVINDTVDEHVVEKDEWQMSQLDMDNARQATQLERDANRRNTRLERDANRWANRRNRASADAAVSTGGTPSTQEPPRSWDPSLKSQNEDSQSRPPSSQPSQPTAQESQTSQSQSKGQDGKSTGEVNSEQERTRKDRDNRLTVNIKPAEDFEEAVAEAIRRIRGSISDFAMDEMVNAYKLQMEGTYL